MEISIFLKLSDRSHQSIHETNREKMFELAKKKMILVISEIELHGYKNESKWKTKVEKIFFKKWLESH